MYGKWANPKIAIFLRKIEGKVYKFLIIVKESIKTNCALGIIHQEGRNIKTFIETLPICRNMSATKAE